MSERNIDGQGGPPASENPEVAERHLPTLLTDLMDGSVKAAAGYAVGKGMEKVFGGRGPGSKDQPPPPADPPPDADPPLPANRV